MVKVIEKGFFSLFLLLFISVFIFYILEESKTEINSKEFITTAILDNKKQSHFLSIEQIIKNELNENINNPVTLKENINNRISNYNLNKNTLFLKNKITKDKDKLTKDNLDLMTQVIVYKPTKNTNIKIYFINHGLLQNKQLIIEEYSGWLYSQ
jgi:hypothetical protein